MKNLLPFILAIIVALSSCATKKYMQEFYSEKDDGKIEIIWNAIDSVETTKAMNVLFSRYIDEAPENDSLLLVTNEFLKLYLVENGYAILENAKENLLSDKTYQIIWNEYQYKEVKTSETLTDSISGSSKTVKLKGVDVKLKGRVYHLNAPNLAKEVSVSDGQMESQEGEFKHTKGLGDLIAGNKSGSTKYKFDVNKLGDEVFYFLCHEVAHQMAVEIDDAIGKLYVKLRKEK